jgi:hypothetical protein
VDVQDNEAGDKVLLERVAKRKYRRHSKLEFVWLGWREARLRRRRRPDHDSALAWEWQVGPLLIRRYKGAT